MAQQPVFQLRIRLKGVDPAVWRRLLVPGGVRLAKLHDIFQAAMGWTNSHLHSFTIGDELYGMQFDDYPEEELDEKEYTVFVALRGGVRRFVYDYDFGDSWKHEVVVEDVTWSPYVLEARRVPGRREGLPARRRRRHRGLCASSSRRWPIPLHEEHDSYLVWVGYKFDPEAFNVAAANAALQRVR